VALLGDKCGDTNCAEFCPATGLHKDVPHMPVSDSFALAPRSRILIFRLSGLSECIHSLPVACALRDHDSTFEIGWVVEGNTAEILRGHRAIDQVIALPSGWYKSWATMTRARQAVREFAPAVTIDLQGLTKSAALAASSGANIRVGFAGQEGGELSSWFNNRRLAAGAVHAVDKNLELLTLLGIAPHTPRFDLADDAAVAAKLRRWTAEERLLAGYAVLNPGAGAPNKRWPVERFAAVAAGLHDRFGLRSVVTWAPGEERNWAEQIVSQANGAAVLAPPTTLVELMSLAREAKILISGDTGPLHLAAAVGSPCVALFGASDAQRCGPYGQRHRVLQPVPLAGSSRLRHHDENSALLAITVKGVLNAAGEILRELPREQQHAA